MDEVLCNHDSCKEPAYSEIRFGGFGNNATLTNTVLCRKHAKEAWIKVKPHLDLALMHWTNWPIGERSADPNGWYTHGERWNERISDG